MDGIAGQISWTDQLDGSAGQTSSLYLKPWPVRIFEDSPLSLYVVAASESDEGLVFKQVGILPEIEWYHYQRANAAPTAKVQNGIKTDPF